MGTRNSSAKKIKNPKNFIIGTLNYSGLNNSPYQFYEYETDSQQKQQSKLNDTFKQLCQKEFPETAALKVQWLFKDLDKIYRERYSPLYLKDCGIDEQNFLMDRRDFMKKWKEYYEQRWIQKTIFNTLEEWKKKSKLEKLEKTVLMILKQFDSSKIAQDESSIRQCSIINNSQNQQNISQNKLFSLPNNTYKLHKNQQQSSSNQLFTKKQAQFNLPNFQNMIIPKIQVNSGRLGRSQQNQVSSSSLIKVKKKDMDLWEKVKEQMMRFDFLVYKAIVSVVYGKEVAQEIENKDSNQRADKYWQFQENKFQKSFLNQEKKLDKLKCALENFSIDILFLQNLPLDVIDLLQKKIKQYRIIFNPEKCVNAILIKIKSFPKNQHLIKANFSLIQKQRNIILSLIHDKKQNIKECKTDQEILKQEENQVKNCLKRTFEILNLNGETIIQFLEGFILISTHLTPAPHNRNKNTYCQANESKKLIDESSKIETELIKIIEENKKLQYNSKNQNQLHKLKLCLQFLKSRFPNYQILLGGMLNNDEINWYSGDQTKFPSKFNEFSQQAQKGSASSENYQIHEEDIIEDDDEGNKSSQKTIESNNSQKNSFQKFYIFPSMSEEENFMTSNQKRTCMQAQRTKENQQVTRRKDYLVSDFQLTKCIVCTVDRRIIKAKFKKVEEVEEVENMNKEASTSTIMMNVKNKDKLSEPQITQQLPMLPNNFHPFGSYLVLGEVKVAQNNQKNAKK